MTACEQIKTTDNKIEEKKKTQYDSELQTSRISDLPSRIISKYEFLTN